MIAAEAPTKEQNDSDLRTLALEDLMRENDALSAAFDVEVFDILRRTPRRLDMWADSRGGPIPSSTCCPALLPRETTAKFANPTSALGWMGLGAPIRTERKQHQELSAWVQDRPVGPTSIVP